MLVSKIHGEIDLKHIIKRIWGRIQVVRRRKKMLQLAILNSL